MPLDRRRVRFVTHRDAGAEAMGRRCVPLASDVGAIRATLGRAGIRAELDSRNEKLGFKIREAELQKIPVMAVVGDEETSRGTVTPRRRGRGKKGGEAIGLEAFAASLTEEIQRRGR